MLFIYLNVYVYIYISYILNKLVLGKPADLISDVWSNRGILITTYSGLLQHIDNLLKRDWHYVVLDEGHKIRNPDSKVS